MSELFKFLAIILQFDVKYLKKNSKVLTR